MDRRLRLVAENPAGADDRRHEDQPDRDGEQRRQRVTQRALAAARPEAFVKGPGRDRDDARPAERRQIFSEGPKREQDERRAEGEPRRRLAAAGRLGGRNGIGGLYGH